jgi:hypothetical protein
MEYGSSFSRADLHGSENGGVSRRGKTFLAINGRTPAEGCRCPGLESLDWDLLVHGWLRSALLPKDPPLLRISAALADELVAELAVFGCFRAKDTLARALQEWRLQGGGELGLPKKMKETYKKVLRRNWSAARPRPHRREQNGGAETGISCCCRKVLVGGCRRRVRAVCSLKIWDGFFDRESGRRQPGIGVS